MQTPSVDGNLEALQNLLRQRGAPSATSQWRRNLADLCSVVASQTRNAARSRQAQNQGSPKKPDAAGSTADANKFLANLTLCTSLAGFFRLIDRDNDAKIEVIECFSSILAQFPPLGLTGLHNEAQIEGLARAQEYLTESVQQGSVAKEACIDALIGLAIARGSLSTNIGLCKLLLKCPELVQRRHIQRFQQLAETSTPWFADRSLEALWTKQVLPVLRGVLEDDSRNGAPDPASGPAGGGSVDQKWQEIVEVLKQGKTELAAAAVTELLGGRPLPEGCKLPSLEDAAAPDIPTRVAPSGANNGGRTVNNGGGAGGVANGRGHDDGAEGRGFVAQLLERLAGRESGGGGEARCEGREAAGAFVVQLYGLAQRVELPSAVDRAKTQDPPEHVAGALGDVAALCELLDAMQPGDRGDEDPCLHVIMLALLQVLLVNIRFHAAGTKYSLEEGSSDDGRHISTVEATLRRLLLGEFALEAVGEKGRALVAECYSEGLGLFFKEPSPLIGALQPLLDTIRSSTASGTDDQVPARASKQLAAIVMTHLCRHETMRGLLVVPDEEGGGGKAGKDDTKEAKAEASQLNGSSEGDENASLRGSDAMRELMEALLGCLLNELEAHVKQGKPFQAEARSERPMEAEVLEWRWDRISRNFDSEDKLAVKNTRGRVGMAVGEKCLRSGRHMWQLRIGDVGNGEMWVGVTPTNINVDCGTGNNMTLWMPDGTVKAPQQSDMYIEGYGGGDVLSLVLDMEDAGGKITFYKNDAPVGGVSVVKKGTLEPFPCIILKDSCQHLTLMRSLTLTVDGDGLPTAAGPSVEGNFAVACASAWAKAVLVLDAEIATSKSRRPQLQLLAAHLVDLVFRRLTTFLDAALPSITDSPDSILPLLSTLDHLPGSSNVGRRHLLTWIPNVLALASRLDPSLCDPVARAQPVLACIHSLRALLAAHPEFATFRGRCFRSFALCGLEFGRPKLFVKVSHPECLEEQWTVEVVFRRGRVPPGSETDASVLLGAQSFAVEVDRVTGRLGIADLGSEEAEGRKRLVLPGTFPPDEWAMATLVCGEGTMTVYRDGAQLGSVRGSWPLQLQCIGACGQRDKRSHFLVGAVRSVRVWRRALAQAEVEQQAGIGAVGDEGGEGGVAAGHVLGVGLTSAQERTVELLPGSEGSAASLEGCAAGLVAGEAEEPHWLRGFVLMLNGMLSSLAMAMVRGQRRSAEDEEAAKAMARPIFARGLEQETAHAELLDASDPLAPTDALAALLLPAVGVRAAKELDVLERAFILAVLHHCGLASRVAEAPSARSALVEATCSSAARAARALRDRVCRERDLALKQLPADVDPPSWGEVCAPFLARCRFLLRVPAMGSAEGSAADVCATQPQVEAHRALAVYRKIWQQAVGDGRVRSAIEEVTEFTVEGPEPGVAERALRWRQSRAAEVQAGMETLRVLLEVRPVQRLQEDTLEVMASAGGAENHYLSSVAGIGGAVAEGVRAAFAVLATQLVAIAGEGTERAEAIGGAAEALMVALDREDMAALLQTPLIEHVCEFWARRVESGSVELSVLRSMSRLTAGLLLQQGLHSRQLEAAQTERVLRCGYTALKSLCAATAGGELEDGGSMRFAGTCQLADGEEEEDEVAMTLFEERGDLSVLRHATGHAVIGGREYAVEGLLRGSSPEAMAVCLMLSPTETSSGPRLAVTGMLDQGVLHGRWQRDGEKAERESMSMLLVQDGVPRGFFNRQRLHAVNKRRVPAIFGGHLTWRGGDPIGTTYAVLPVTPDACSIQVQILKGPKDKVELAVGVVKDAYSISAFPGWETGSIAYHADNAEVYLDRTACAVGKTASVGDVIGCTVQFLGTGEPQRVVWSLNGVETVAVEVAGKLPEKIYFALGGHASGSKPLVVVVTQGAGRFGRSGERELKEAKVRAIESLVETLSKVGHHKAVRAQLLHEDWVSLLWSILLSPHFTFGPRANALAVLALSLLEPGTLAPAQTKHSLRLLFDLIARLSPEAHVSGLPEMPAAALSELETVSEDDERSTERASTEAGRGRRSWSGTGDAPPSVDLAAPDLTLRSHVLALVRRLARMAHVRGALQAVLLGKLQQLRDAWATDAPLGECLGAVLALGGVLDELSGGGEEGGWWDGGRGLLDREVVFAVMEVCGVVAGERRSVEGSRGAAMAMAVRARVLKAVWEVRRQCPDEVDAVLEARGELLGRLVSVASGRWRVPLTPLAQGTVMTAPPKFRDVGVNGKKIPNVVLSNGGSTCKITGERTVPVAGEMVPGTGTYYVEYLVETANHYATVGIGVADYTKFESFAKSGYKGASSDDDFKDDGNWEKDNLRRTEKFVFAAQDYVGVQLDTDEMRLAFTKNGKIIATYAKVLPRRTYMFMVSASSRFTLTIAKTPKYAAIRTVGGAVAAASSVSAVESNWVTMEMLIAKSHALSLQLGHSSRPRDSCAPSPTLTDQIPACAAIPEHPARMYAREMYPSVRSALFGSEGTGARSTEPPPDYKEDLSLDMQPFATAASRGPAGEQHAGGGGGSDGGDSAKTSAWRTSGDAAELLLRTEEALAIGFARVLVMDLLAWGHAGVGARVDADALLALVSPFFPPGSEGGCPRSLFAAGPYADVHATLDKTIRGWVRGRRAAVGALLEGDLRVLAGECREIVEGVLCARALLSQGVTELRFPHDPRFVRPGASSVTWYRPGVVHLHKTQAQTERGTLRGGALSLSVWLAPHLCSRRALGGAAGSEVQVAELLQGLLEAQRELTEPTLQLQLLRSLVASLAGMDAAAALRLREQSLPLLQELHTDTLLRLQGEGGGTSSGGVFFSPLLQACASVVVAVDLAISGGDAVNAVKTLRTLTIPPKTQVAKHPPKVQELVNQLLDMGFAEAAIEAGLKEKGEVDSLNTEQGMELMDWLSSNPDAAAPEEQAQLEAAEELRDWRLRRDPKAEAALKALEALLSLQQLLHSLRDRTPLLECVRDRAKLQVATRRHFASFDDRDPSGGVAVYGGCSRARLRGSVPRGRWGSVRGNLPFDHVNTWLSIHVSRRRTCPRRWRGALRIGVAVVDGEWSSQQRGELAESGAPSASSVTWEMGSCVVQAASESGGATEVTAAAAFAPGSVVGLHVKPRGVGARTLVLYVASSPSSPFVHACSLDLPGRVGAVLPLVSLQDGGFEARIVAVQPPTEVANAASHRNPERPSLVDGPVAFPGRNQLSEAGMDWEAALDPDWPATTDALLVEYAVQRAAMLGKHVADLPVCDLFPESPPGPPTPSDRRADGGLQSVAAALEREPSRLPPVVRSISRLRSMSGLALQHSVGLRAAQQAETVTLPAVGVSLSELSAPALEARFALLKVLNEWVRAAVPLVDLQAFDRRAEMAHLLAARKGVLFPEMKNDLFGKTLHATQLSGGQPDVALNRGTHTAERRRRERTVFEQLRKQVESGGHSLVGFSDRRDGNRMAWQVHFVGEGGSDHGGLYRDSIREMALELQCPARRGLQLLIPSPNQRRSTGSNQDKWVPNPACVSADDLRCFKFLGRVMGACLRTNAPLELDLPSVVWKVMVGEECGVADVAAIDERFGAEVEQWQGVASAGEWEEKGVLWRVRSVSGRMCGLVPGGRTTQVAWADRDAFVHAAVQYRLAETAPQVAAIREGLLAVIPSRALPLFTWRELQVRICGVPVIAVEKLKKITVYDEFEGGEQHAVAQMFWTVVGGMSNEDRSSLLAFCWGKRRLPAENSGVHLTLHFARGMDDGHLPLSHTCVFQLDLPNYSSAEVMREKLLYAIRSCTAIDNDNRAGGTLYASDDEEEAEAANQTGFEAEDEEDADQEDFPPEGTAAGGRGWLTVPLDGGHTRSRVAVSVSLPPPPESESAGVKGDGARGSAAVGPGGERGGEEGEGGACVVS